MQTLPVHFTIQTINSAAATLFQLLQQNRIVALHAPMGAGKTTLVSYTVQLAGSTDAVTSPTYALMNQYTLPGGKMLWHMDWYRVEDESEAIEAGIEDTLLSGDYCLVEWPEKLPGLLPDHTLHLKIAVNEDGSRTLDYHP